MKLGRIQLGAILALAAVLAGADAPPAPATKPTGWEQADQPLPRLDTRTGQPNKGWMKHHDGLVEQAKKGGIDLYFEGDSITDFWTPNLNNHMVTGLEVWNKEFGGWNPGDFGVAGDRTEHVLWRLDNGELDGVKPKAIVLMIGTNNCKTNAPEETAAGVAAIVNKLKEKEPQAKILLLAIFPRGPKPDDQWRQVNDQVNAIIAKEDFGPQVKYLDIGEKFLQADGTLTREIMTDYLHPSPKGYQIWADAIKPVLTEWLAPPQAPAATMPAK
ncbi:MAG TPA: GDSL-type esterase/lipase family protein [Phycisphaerae bacterium]|nr:GDSL-type esterase/lipase family protein [Phycisphaerae bacterium]